MNGSAKAAGVPTVAVVVLIVLAGVGCSGSQPGPPLDHDDVAVVGAVHISKSTYDNLLARAEKIATHTYTAQPESSAALSSAVMTRLVSEAEQTNAALSQHTTVKALRARVEARARVGAAVRATFEGYFGDGPRRARETRMILLYDRPVAQTVFARLSVGSDATWCALALQSVEHGPGNRCGTELVPNGGLVEPLDKVVFSIRQGVPTLVRASNGYWTILEAVSPIYNGGTQKQIHTLLLTQSKTVRLGRWEAALAHGYCTGKNVAYRRGYQPNPDPTQCAQKS